MKHEAVQRLLSASDRPLGLAVMQEIKAHAVSCKDCRELYERWLKFTR